MGKGCLGPIITMSLKPFMYQHDKVNDTGNNPGGRGAELIQLYALADPP